MNDLGFQGPLVETGTNITERLPKLWNYFMKTFLPLLEASMIRLYGSYDKFKRYYGGTQLLSDSSGAMIGLTVDLIYTIPDIQGTTAEEKDIEDDRGFLVTQLAPLAQFVKVNQQSIRYDFSEGTLRITATIKGIK